MPGEGAGETREPTPTSRGAPATHTGMFRPATLMSSQYACLCAVASGGSGPGGCRLQELSLPKLGRASGQSSLKRAAAAAAAFEKPAGPRAGSEGGG